MKFERNVIVERVRSHNDLAQCVNSRKVAIFIEGQLYEDMKKSIKGNKTSGKLGGFILAGGLLTGGALPIILASLGLLINKIEVKDFNDYKIKLNEESSRIELYLKKGSNKYDPKYDTLIY